MEPSTIRLLFPSIPVIRPPLAHQGGWDEILLVVAPLAIIALLLYIANRRVKAQLEQSQDVDDHG